MTDQLSVEALRDAISRVLDAVVRYGTDGPDLGFDYFWAIIDPRILDDPARLQPEPTVAQVSELLERLRDPSFGESDHLPSLGTELRWLAELLSALAAHLEQGRWSEVDPR